MVLTESEKNHIRAFIKTGDSVALYEYIENLISKRIDEALWSDNILNV